MENGDPSEQRMLEEVVERQNMRAAYQQVKRNAGAPGIDGMSVEELRGYLEAGVMDAGLVSPTTEGTPQGGRSRRQRCSVPILAPPRR